MYILSKYKDYYDYLSGVYGIDEKIVLDRRINTPIPYLYTGFRLYIAGYIVEGYYDKESKKCYYGEDLKQFTKSIMYYPSKHWNRNYSKSIWIHNKIGFGEWLYLEPIKDKHKINIKEKCPIIYVHHKDYYYYPQLSKLDLASFIKPEIIYKWIEEWISNRISDKENITDDRSDIDKLQDKGFDKKKSFRKM